MILNISINLNFVLDFLFHSVSYHLLLLVLYYIISLLKGSKILKIDPIRFHQHSF